MRDARYATGAEKPKTVCEFRFRDLAITEPGAKIIEIDQKADMQVCKYASSGKATLLEPIDLSEILAASTPELVTEKCREVIEILAPGGGFILGPGCALPSTTPDENIDALIEAAKIYGRYD